MKASFKHERMVPSCFCLVHKSIYPTHLTLQKKLATPGQRCIQSIVGKFLYYGRAVDHTVLATLGEISTAQAAPTTDTVQKTSMLMDYLHTFPNAKLRFYARDMQLHIKSDAAYLVLPGARSCAASHFYLSASATPNKAYKGRFNTIGYGTGRPRTNLKSDGTREFIILQIISQNIILQCTIGLNGMITY